MSGKVLAEKLTPKTWNEFVVAIFLLADFNNITHGVMSVLLIGVWSWWLNTTEPDVPYAGCTLS